MAVLNLLEHSFDCDVTSLQLMQSLLFSGLSSCIWRVWFCHFDELLEKNLINVGTICCLHDCLTLIILLIRLICCDDVVVGRQFYNGVTNYIIDI